MDVFKVSAHPVDKNKKDKNFFHQNYVLHDPHFILKFSYKTTGDIVVLGQIVQY